MTATRSVCIRFLFSCIIGIFPVQLFAAENIIAIDSLHFDTATHLFYMSWSLDTSDVPIGCQASIAAITGPVELPTSPDYYFSITELTGDTTFSLLDLTYDTTWKIGLWLRLGVDWLPPDSSAFHSIYIPPATWEPVKLFSIPIEDTLKIFQERILLWRDDTYDKNLPVHTDTMRHYIIPSKRLTGLHNSGLSFSFEHPLPSSPFFIGFRYDTSFSHYPLYRIFRDSSGLLIADHNSVVDTTRHLVYVKTTQLDYPFLLLADTIKPTISFLSDTSKTIGSSDIDIKFKVKDNIANCRWQVFSNSGNEPPISLPATHSGYLGSTSEELSCRLPVTGASESGLCIYLILSDGTYSDTINISQQARRTRSNETTVPANMIFPLAPTADLDSTSCRYALRKLFKQTSGGYKKSTFRIYRWYSDGNNSERKWVEYSSKKASVFSFNPGRLFWLIVKNETLLDFGNGRSPSLKDTLAITLPARQWTDFSLPYSFSVPFSNVIKTTGSQSSKLYCYRWEKDDKHRTYHAEAHYLSGVSGMDSLSTLLTHGSNGYFTVFNNSDSAFTLRIPPTPADAENGTLSKKQTVPMSSGWTVGFDLKQNNTTVSRVYYGGSSALTKQQTVPTPPSFPGNPILSITSAGTSTSSGTVIVPLENDVTHTCTLTISNPGSSPAVVTCLSKKISGAVNGIVTTDKRVQPIDKSLLLTVNARSTKTVICYLSATQSIEDLSQFHKASIAVLHPHIIALTRYSHGASTRVTVTFDSPTSRNRIDLFDLQGRSLASTECTAPDKRSQLTATLPVRSVAHACYIVRLSAIDTNGTTKQIIRHLLLSE